MMMTRIHATIAASIICLTVTNCLSPSSHAATVGYWRFENDLLDISGNDNHATIIPNGIAFGPDAAAVFGTPIPRTGSENNFALDLDNEFGFSPAKRAAHYLEVPHNNINNSLDIATGSFTIEAWVRMEQTGNDPIRQYIVQKKDRDHADNLASFAFLSKAGNLGDELLGQQWKMALALPNGSSEKLIFSSLGFEDSGEADWHYMSVAVDRPSGDVRFMLDDAVDYHVGVAGLGMNNADALFIGAHSTDHPNFQPEGANHGLVGGLDELRISNAFLSTSQLLAVPEPATVTLAIAGLILLIGFWTLTARRRSITRRHLDANPANSS